MATESVKILIEAEDKATAQLKKAVSEQEKVEAKAELSRVRAQKSLAAERIELQKGSEAAYAFKLMLDGVSESESKLIAREKELLSEQKKRNAEQEKINNTGSAKTTKASTEFFGAVAGMAGGSQIASVAGQLSGLTEKISQFAEVAKQGGTSAMLFKAGLASAALTIGFQVGKAIGDLYWQTEEVNKELAKSIEKADKLNGLLADVKNQALADDLSKIDLMPKDSQQSALKGKLKEIQTELKGVKSQSTEAENKLKELEKWEGYELSFRTTTGLVLEKELELARNEIKRTEEELDRLSGAQKTVERKMTIDVELENLQKIKDGREYIKGLSEYVMKLKAEQFFNNKGKFTAALNEFEARKNTGNKEDAKKAEALLNDLSKLQMEKEKKGELDKLKEKNILLTQGKEAAKQFALEQQGMSKQDAKIVAAEEARLDRLEKEKEKLKTVFELKKGELNKLKEQATLLSEGAKGKEAAYRFNLEKQGVSKNEARFLAAEQAKLDKLQAAKDAKAAKKPDLQASESRLLTRGPEQDQTAKNTAEIARLAKEQLDRLNKIVVKQDKPTGKTDKLELVSR